MVRRRIGIRVQCQLKELAYWAKICQLRMRTLLKRIRELEDWKKTVEEKEKAKAEKKKTKKDNRERRRLIPWTPTESD